MNTISLQISTNVYAILLIGFGGARCVTVLAVRIGIVDPSSNPGPGCSRVPKF